VVGMVSIFTYGFEEATRNFEEAGVSLRSLTNYPELISIAIEKGIVSGEQKTILLKWSSNPSEWKRL